MIAGLIASAVTKSNETPLGTDRIAGPAFCCRPGSKSSFFLTNFFEYLSLVIPNQFEFFACKVCSAVIYKLDWLVSRDSGLKARRFESIFMDSTLLF